MSPVIQIYRLMRDDPYGHGPRYWNEMTKNGVANGGTIYRGEDEAKAARKLLPRNGAGWRLDAWDPA